MIRKLKNLFKKRTIDAPKVLTPDRQNLLPQTLPGFIPKVVIENSTGELYRIEEVAGDTLVGFTVANELKMLDIEDVTVVSWVKQESL